MGERKRRIQIIERELTRLTLDVAALKAKSIGAVTVPQAVHELLRLEAPDGCSGLERDAWLAGVGEAIGVLRRLAKFEDFCPGEGLKAALDWSAASGVALSGE